MSIVIVTEKVITKCGNEGRRLKRIRLMSHDDLPERYLRSTTEPIAYLGHDNNLCLKNHNIQDLNLYYYREGDVITEGVLQALLTHLKKAGNHLRAINEDLAEKRRNWHGTEGFVI